MVLGKNTTVNGNHVMEGLSSGRNILRISLFRFAPGATPGTNINCTHFVTFNSPSVTNGTNIAASGSSGSFALNASGQEITLDITEDFIGASFGIIGTHNINSSSTTEM